MAAKKAPLSPHETVTASVGGKTITITYGRPYMKGRKIFGGLEPFGKVWRTGADDATTFLHGRRFDAWLIARAGWNLCAVHDPN